VDLCEFGAAGKGSSSVVFADFCGVSEGEAGGGAFFVVMGMKKA
jgi:hypothetical protein